MKVFFGLIFFVATAYWSWHLTHGKSYQDLNWLRHNWQALILLLISFSLLGSVISGWLLLGLTGYWGWHLFKRQNYRGLQLFKHGWPIIVLLFTSLIMFAIPGTADATPKPTVKVETVKKTHAITVKNDHKLQALQKANASSASSLKTEASDLTKEKSKVDQKKAQNQKDGATKATATTAVKVGDNPSATDLADRTYAGEQTITVNDNHPAFSQDDLSTSQGAWQRYGNLDQLNRVTAANALLNQSLMPKSKREPLNVDPTGWRNKKIASGWLYNRSHLIGYQLTGQNNNFKNLMTGTRSLNAPEMVTYENQVAEYLKADPKHYVRYQVTPIFKDNDLLARGVQMRGQSIGDDTVSFNIYIFNVQAGMTLNYGDGTSRVAN